MSASLHTWLESDVAPYRGRSVAWLSQYHFFRDPMRPSFSDPGLFFSPADGLILYQRVVGPAEDIVAIKGGTYSLRDALRDPGFDRTCLVIGIFMTFFDVHVNRVPYAGWLSYRELEPLHTQNRPMLEVEQRILDELRLGPEHLEYLHTNQRVVNRVRSSALGQSYYVLQIADYDVDCITPFCLRQNAFVKQGGRFSMVRYGSQVDLVIPLSPRFDFQPVQPAGWHVEAGVDALVAVRPRRRAPRRRP